MASRSRQDEAREVAESLLDDLEVANRPVEQCLMKAKRLARLLRDEEAQRWLELEAVGYPQEWSVFLAAIAEVPSCEKYIRAGRVRSDGSFYHQSVPQMEAGLEAARARIAGLQAPTTIAPSASAGGGPHVDFTGVQIANATKAAVNAVLAKGDVYYQAQIADTRTFQAMKSALHSYAAETQFAISFGDVAEGIFDAARREVDAFIRATAPRAAEQLLAIHERLRDGSDEARAQALTSCRRVLLTVADAVFPAQPAPYTSNGGKQYMVGIEQYKNRLMAFLDQHADGSSTSAIQTAELEHLAGRLDAVYEKTNKGVHADVSEGEARLATIHTYLVIAEVARASSGTVASAQGSEAGTGTDPTVSAASENSTVAVEAAPVAESAVSATPEAEGASSSGARATSPGDPTNGASTPAS